MKTTRWQSFQPWGGAAVRAVFLSRLATALDLGNEPDIGLRDGLAVQRVIDAAYRSSENSLATRVDDPAVEQVVA